MPLAHLLRPTILDEIIGQKHLLGEGCILRKIIENDDLHSAIFYGPAGTGKTTVAEVISKMTKSTFVKFNATSAKISEIRAIGDRARKLESSIVMFVDEIHRFAKNQQDVLLPFIEQGFVTFIGATTENPYHSITSPLVSRSQLFKFEELTMKELGELIVRAIKYYKNKGRKISITMQAMKHIINMSCGDGRKVLALTELAVSMFDGDVIEITEELARQVAPSKYVIFDESSHFDLASAYQGSIQASDPDAAVYWLAKWLESGEDPRYIARRLLVSASEDASGDPMCSMVAQAAYTAACEIGRPECDIILSHATIMTATSKRDKSAAMAIWSALKDVRNDLDIAVPKEMKDNHYKGAKKLGHGAYKDGLDQSSYVGIKKKYYKPNFEKVK